MRKYSISFSLTRGPSGSAAIERVPLAAAMKLIAKTKARGTNLCNMRKNR
jgi:hypothetical protein